MFGRDEKFCSNPRCALHVSPKDANVEGHGEWATLPNGCTFARVRVGENYYWSLVQRKIPTIRHCSIFSARSNTVVDPCVVS